ncbi:hypothetical protein LWF01_07530 [Saxibacter everestensis]|uniref:Uncharacterized protein n=1 Tax=Saxibacter everestensis TaxID=2909229 RepID=A0ABY8QXB5_9MICO|nr:hypothetical protein LWF01_07530 [Brevibacteriaceae bacterium ZFBP1038]
MRIESDMFDFTVRANLPWNFDAYARILIPGTVGDTPVAWSTIRKSLGLPPGDRLMQWEEFANGDLYNSVHVEGLGTVDPPFGGEITEPMLDAVLHAFNADRASLKFAAWDSYSLPQLGPKLFTIFDKDFYPTAPPEDYPAPVFVYASDRSWAAHANSDAGDVVVGGPETGIERLVSDGSVEAYRVTPNDRLDWREK